MVEETPQNIDPATDPQVEETAPTAVPASEIDTGPAFVAPATNPEVPQPASAQAVTLAPPPDEAFLEQQTAQENRWIQAAATNPDGINRNGSVVIDRGGGLRETINRDGSYEISSVEGTVRFDAAGQQTSYTTPTINGLSRTYTTDGVVVETYSAGPLRTESISYNGELVSTNTTLQTGAVTLQQIQVGEGPPVNAAITVIPNLTEGTAGLQITQAQVGDGEIVASTLDLEQRRLDRLAADEARAEAADQLQQDIRASQAQVESGIPLSATQLAAIEEQAQALEAAEAAVLQAEEALAEADPTIVAADTNPQVVEAVDQDPIPSFDNTEFAPAPINPANDPEVAELAAAQEEAEFVPVADVDTGPTPVDAADDPEVAGYELAQTVEEPIPTEIEVDPTVVTEADPQTIDPISDDLPEAFIYESADVPDQDPVVLAQSSVTQTDVVVTDIEIEPTSVDAATDVVAQGRDVDVTAVPPSEIDVAPLAIDSDIDPVAPAVEAPSQGGFFGEPTPVGGNFTSSYDPETGTYDVVDLDTGQVVETGLSQQQATLAAQEFSLGDPQFPNDTEALAPSDLITEPTDVDVAEAAFVETDTGFFELQEEAAPVPDEFGFVETDDGFFVQQDEIEATIDQQQFEDELGAEEFPVPVSEVETEPGDVDPEQDPYAQLVEETEAEGGLVEFTPDGPVGRSNAEVNQAANRLNGTINARRQAEFQQQIKEANDGDWRVRLRLAPNANYLYKDPSGPGILTPLKKTDGVIFPYTPQITTAYKANYSSYDLTHSNYRGFFYQNSYVDDIQINSIFTAQDSVEAEYLLAVIHFFRSATKMFYGLDAQRGAPPPIVYLQGHGVFQFNLVPCVIGQFNYNLPNDVDYIRARSPNVNGTNLLQRRSRTAAPTDPFSSAVSRIANLLKPQNIRPGAQPAPPAAPTLGTNQPTYVPTKMEISLILHPIQSRQQVSQQFSLEQYANGQLLRGGFW